MSWAPESPQLLTHILIEQNNIPTTFSIRLSWVNPVNYDGLRVAWGVGTSKTSPSPNSAALNPTWQSYTIDGFSPITSVVLKVQGAVHGDLLQGTDPAELYWSDWTAINVTVPHSLTEVLLLYKIFQGKGSACTATITSGTQIENPNQIGTWDPDWTQLTSFVVGGNPFLLLYKQSGGMTFTAPIIAGPNIGTSTKISSPLLGTTAFAQRPGWSQITSFVQGNPFLLFYNQKTGDAFTAPIISGTQIGQPTEIGPWATDWTQITSFAVGGSPFLLFYNQTTGGAFTTPIIPGTEKIDKAKLTKIGTWDKDWTQITSFVVGGNPFLLLYKQMDVLEAPTTFTAPIISGTQIGTITPIGHWGNWAHIGPLFS